MNFMNNYYEILHINTDASSKEIKKAYRSLAMEWHPDKNKSPAAHDKFILINEAYNILINPEKRKIYDQLLEAYKREQHSISTYNTKNKERYREWVKDEQKKAQNLASLSFEKFAKHLIKTIENTVDAAYIGCLYYIAIVFVIAGIISMFEYINNYDPMVTSKFIFIIQMLWSGLFVFGGSYWIYRSIKKKS